MGLNDAPPLDMTPVPDPGLRNPARVPWYMHKRTQGAITSTIGAVLAIATPSPEIVNVIIMGLGAVWAIIGHVDAEERKVTALTLAARVEKAVPSKVEEVKP